jgi:hypothetical protein
LADKPLTDLELQALVALVNAQTAELNTATAQSVAAGEQPNYRTYNQGPRERLTKELDRRGAL